MKHESCKYYNEFISLLEKEHSGFMLKTLAKECGCSTERIRRIRIGAIQMDVNDLSVLVKKYNANPMYLITGLEPLKLENTNSDVVNEPHEKYITAQEQIAMLKALCESKDHVIRLQQDKLNESGKGNGAKRA